MFYAYIIKGEKGITDSWEKCQKKVAGISNAKFKKFKTEKEAKEFINSNGEIQKTYVLLDNNAVYCDSGTGGNGVTKIRVVNSNGTSLLKGYDFKSLAKQLEIQNSKLTDDGTLTIIHRTNNFGELLAFYIALEIAGKKHKKGKKYNKVYCDSELVLNHWSKGNIKKTEDKVTANLSRMVTELRAEFEKKTGRKVCQIKGELNPADLGFHKSKSNVVAVTGHVKNCISLKKYMNKLKKG